MRKYALLLAIIGFTFTGISQGEAPLSKGEKQLNLGIKGLGNTLPVYGSLEFAVHDDITVGPIASINFFSGNTALRVGAIGNYHWNTLIGIPKEWDFYAGLNAGFKIDFDNSNNNNFNVGGQFGGRWFWSEKWALNVELGISNSIGGGFGVTMKL